MSFNPKIGSLEAMQVDLDDPTMLVASTEHGVAAKCNPMTGKVSHRHLLYSTNESIRLQLTAVKMDKDRILWGFGPGFITLSTRTKSTSRLKVFSDFHQGPVCILSLPQHVQDIVLSGAEDGTVKVWDVATTSCVWTLLPISASARIPTCLEVTADHRIIVGYDDGSIVVWHVNLNQLIQLNRNRHQDDFVEKKESLEKKMQDEKAVLNAPTSDTRIGVKYATYDMDSKMVIVAYQGHPDVLKFCTNTGACVGTFSYGHAAGSSITCMQWDISPLSTTLSLESALKPRPATAKRKGGGIIDVSTSTSSSSPASKSGLSSGQGTPSSVKTTRLLVTGDDMGTICLWNGDDTNKGHVSIKPLRILTGHLVGISAIYIDACKIVTGSDDGWIYMWDPLTGANINTLGNKIPKNAPVDRTDMNVMRVKNLWCNDYQGIATIGHQVKTWDFSPGKQFLSRRAVKQKGKPCNNVVRDRIRYEIGREVKESISKLESEKLEREMEEKEINKLSLGGLSDEEMLAYAMMLSEQENNQSTSSPLNKTDLVDDEDEELMKAVIASLEQPTFEHEGSDESNNTTSYSASTNSLSRLDNDDDDYNQWPTVADSVVATPSVQENDEDLDEELRYILELSKTDK